MDITLIVTLTGKATTLHNATATDREYIARVDGPNAKLRAHQIEQAFNQYSAHIATLQDAQRVLKHVGPENHHYVLQRLDEVKGQIDRLLAQHKDFEQLLASDNF